MSADETLLLFIDRDGGFESWLRLGEGGVAARGEGLAGMPPLVDPGSGELARLAVAVPAEKVAIHWLEVPTGLAPAQSVAAARLAAADLTAQPLAEMHVAVGRESDADESRCIAIVPHILMTDWLERCQAEGLDPDLMLPEPLLILPPAEGFTRCDRHGPPLYRGPKDAFAIEPELAGVVTGDAPVETIGRGQFESGLPRALARAPVNLRQGPFAKRRRIKVDWARVRRMLLLALAILAVTLAVQLAMIWKYIRAADRLEAQIAEVAGAALPEGADPTAAGLEARLGELDAAGLGFTDVAGPVFAALQATPNVELTGLSYAADGTMRLAVAADMPATIAALEQRIDASGFVVEASPPRVDGGRQVSELVVRPR